MDFSNVAQMDHSSAPFLPSFYFLHGWLESNQLSVQSNRGELNAAVAVSQRHTRISEPTAQESSAAGRSWSSRPTTFGLGGSDKAFLRSCGVHAQIGFRTVMRAQLGRKGSVVLHQLTREKRRHTAPSAPVGAPNYGQTHQLP